jgi:hypothetical protein
MIAYRGPLEQLRRWRQAAVWAPVLWFPIILTAFALDELRLAIAGVFAGSLFAAICVAVVWFGRCPQCTARFGDSSETFRHFWDDATCHACGLSLFELRRRDANSDSS